MGFVDILFNILTMGLPCCLLALGIFLTYRLLDFADLTAEGSFLLGAALCGVMIYNGHNPWLATLAGTAVGFAAGIITGCLNRVLKVPKLLSGIITMTAATSIAFVIFGMKFDVFSPFSENVSINVSYGGTQQTIFSLLYPYEYNADLGMFIIVSPWGEVIKIAVMFGVVAVVMVGLYFFFGTQYGMAIRATGMNETMAKAQGINVDMTSIICVGLSNALIGLAGALYVQSVRGASTTSAQGYLVVGLASIIIGETIFGKRSFKNWLISVSLGAIIYFIIINIALRLGLSTYLMNILYAALIVIALCLPLIKSGIKKLFKKRKERLMEEEN